MYRRRPTDVRLVDDFIEQTVGENIALIRDPRLVDLAHGTTAKLEELYKQHGKNFLVGVKFLALMSPFRLHQERGWQDISAFDPIGYLSALGPVWRKRGEPTDFLVMRDHPRLMPSMWAHEEAVDWLADFRQFCDEASGLIDDATVEMYRRGIFKSFHKQAVDDKGDTIEDPVRVERKVRLYDDPYDVKPTAEEIADPFFADAGVHIDNCLFGSAAARKPGFRRGLSSDQMGPTENVDTDCVIFFPGTLASKFSDGALYALPHSGGHTRGETRAIVAMHRQRIAGPLARRVEAAMRISAQLNSFRAELVNL